MKKSVLGFMFFIIAVYSVHAQSVVMYNDTTDGKVNCYLLIEDVVQLEYDGEIRYKNCEVVEIVLFRFIDNKGSLFDSHDLQTGENLIRFANMSNTDTVCKILVLVRVIEHENVKPSAELHYYVKGKKIIKRY